MPWSPAPSPDLWTGRLPERPPEPDRPGLLETGTAAFRQQNPVASWLTRLQEDLPASSTPLDAFDPFDGLEERYQPWGTAFAGLRSSEQVAVVKGRIDRELSDRETLAAAGWTGIAAQFAAGLLDPLVLLPVGGTAAAAARGFRGVLEAGWITARAGLLTSAASELALQATQETRTLEESAINVAGATLLSGVLGAGVAAVSRRLRPELPLPRAADELGAAVEQDLARDAGEAARPRLSDEDLAADLGDEGLTPEAPRPEAPPSEAPPSEAPPPEPPPPDRAATLAPETPPVARAPEPAPAEPPPLPEAPQALTPAQEAAAARLGERAEAQGLDGGLRQAEALDTGGGAPLPPAALDQVVAWITDSARSLDPALMARRLGLDEAEARRSLEWLASRGERVRQQKSGKFVRATSAADEDLFSFLARAGGLKDEGGELAARGLTRRLVPRAGRLVRREGLSLDRATEAAWQAGYFGAGRERPLIQDLLDLIDRQLAFGRVFPPEAAPTARAVREATTAARAEQARAVETLADEAERVGLPASRADLEEAVQRAADESREPLDVLDEIIERHAIEEEPDLAPSDIRGEGGADLPFGEPGAGPVAEPGGTGQESGTGGRPPLDPAPPPGGSGDPGPGLSGPDGAAVGGEDGGSVGAAFAGPTRAELQLKSMLGVERAIGFADPLLRTLTSPLYAIRKAAIALARNPFLFEGNSRGLATGGSVETLVELWKWPLAQATEELDRSFLRYRGRVAGSGSNRARLLAVQAADLAGAPDGKLTFGGFKAEVSRALRRGDRHAIPEVQAVAQAYRRLLFEPLRKRAVEAGLIDADAAAPAGADSYLTRVYDTRKIVAQRPAFVRVLQDWLTRRQEKRQALQADLQDLAETLADTLDQLRSTEAKVGRLEDRAAVTDAVLGDQRSLMARAIQRAFGQSEREAADRATRARDAVASAQKRSRRSRRAARRDELGMVLEELRRRTNRGQDRQQGQAAQADALAARLDALAGRYDTTLDEIDELLADWPGRAQPKDARAALRRRTDLDELELRDQAEQIVDRILGTPDGRLPYDLDVEPRAGGRGGGDRPDARGPARHRKLTIADELIEPWLEDDVEVIARLYTETMAPDVEIAARFGDLGMTAVEKAVLEEAARRAPGLDEAGRTRLERRKQADLRDLAAMRDRLRGLYGAPADPASVWVRGARVLRQAQLVSKLGGVVVSSIADIARPVMVEGLARVWRHSLQPLVLGSRNLRLARAEARFLGAIVERTLDTRLARWANVGDRYGRDTKVERVFGGLSDSFGLVTLLSPWNQALKEWSALVTSARIVEASRAWSAGTIKRADLERLAAGGIDEATARIIAEQAGRHAITDRGLVIANTADWDAEAAAAITALRAAVSREVNNTIVTPGVGSTPLWMSSQAGRVVGQFKSFAFASAQQVLLAGLQRRDAAALNGFLLSVALGMAVYRIKSWQYDRAPSDDPRVWLSEGIDRAGVTGWLFDVNNILEKTTRGAVGINAALGGPPQSRYASRNIAGALFGPAIGTAQDVTQVIGSVATGDWRESDTRAARRLVPYQNLSYLRWLFDAAERGVNDTFGVEQSQ